MITFNVERRHNNVNAKSKEFLFYKLNLLDKVFGHWSCFSCGKKLYNQLIQLGRILNAAIRPVNSLHNMIYIILQFFNMRRQQLKYNLKRAIKFIQPIFIHKDFLCKICIWGQNTNYDWCTDIGFKNKHFNKLFGV